MAAPADAPQTGTQESCSGHDRHTEEPRDQNTSPTAAKDVPAGRPETPPARAARARQEIPTQGPPCSRPPRGPVPPLLSLKAGPAPKSPSAPAAAACPRPQSPHAGAAQDRGRRPPAPAKHRSWAGPVQTAGKRQAGRSTPAPEPQLRYKAHACPRAVFLITAARAPTVGARTRDPGPRERPHPPVALPHRSAHAHTYGLGQVTRHQIPGHTPRASDPLLSGRSALRFPAHRTQTELEQRTCQGRPRPPPQAPLTPCLNAEQLAGDKCRDSTLCPHVRVHRQSHGRG